ncbi:MAG: endonuclease III [Nanoarchaeota archaeon]
MINQERALKQFHAIEKLASNLRLAADGWDEDWKTLIATLMSARTTDRKTIPVAEELFRNYKTIKELADARLEDIEGLVMGVNFYKTKARNIVNLATILVREYSGNVPRDFDLLVELPGVGRKTANVFLAEKGDSRIGVDTHVNWISKKMDWTKSDKQEVVERDLENLFPKELWGRLNWVLVRFGQTYKSRAKKEELLKKIRNIM